ncbi:unnamed protein product [Rotaria sp. Silwood1]|nr:unnamed protein product [Rotaria sp. Silwood1]
MSIVEVNDIGNPHKDELIQSSSNEKISRSYNRARSVQYPNEYESASHTAKPVTTTSSYFNISHQFKKSFNDSSNRLRRESPRKTVLPFRIIVQDINQYSTTELVIIKEINKNYKLNLTYGRYTKKSKNSNVLFILYQHCNTIQTPDV